jgi:hypothetical protein
MTEGNFLGFYSAMNIVHFAEQSRPGTRPCFGRQKMKIDEIEQKSRLTLSLSGTFNG